jgi:ADP-ribose pyrophosphatase
MNAGLQKTTLFEGKHLRLLKVGHWEYVERTNATGVVIILAITPENKIVLVEQFRIPLGKRVIELPAGLAGDIPGAAGEALATAAKRELLEETGYEAKEMIFLTEGPPSSGLSSETVTFFRAKGLHRLSAGGGDAGEDIQLHEIDLAKIHDWLAEKANQGWLVDPKVYTGLYFAVLSGDIGLP